MNQQALDVIFGAIAAYYIWKWAFRSKALTLKSKIKEYRKHLLHIYNMNNDIYRDKLNETLLDEIEKCKEIAKESDKEVLKNFYEDSQKKMKDQIPSHKYPVMAEYLDILLVAFSLAFAVRAIFLQPFKIPTGSMQPTLHGVNLYDDSRTTVKGEYTDITYQQEVLKRKIVSQPESKIRTFTNSLYYGQQYADIVANSNGFLDPNFSGVPLSKTLKYGIPLLESYSLIGLNGETYALPIPSHKLKREFEDRDGQFSNKMALKGEPIFKGVNEDGDHLFVNRFIYNFRSPQRGDISVFMTNGILYNDNALSGLFYIKRLIGLPGDRFRIKNDQKIYLVEGDKETLLSKEHHPSFDKIYSGKGGYHGHLRSNQAILNGRVVKTRSNSKDLYAFNPTDDLKGNQTYFSYDSSTYKKNGDKYETEDNDTWISVDSEKQVTLYQETQKLVFTRTSNENFIQQSIIRNDGYEAHIYEDYDEYKLGEGQYFMMGDNSAHSLDSRAWGPVPRMNIIGTAFSVFWPFSRRWGFADKVQPEDQPTVEAGRF
ncbi:MAG: signal peptidase I [Lentisphaeraceae bacterium]|nr:signal peptidase I [Lentisphaeraceae bacterium]